MDGSKITECSHHMWFMGINGLICANCKLVMSEPLNVGEWSGVMPVYDAEEDKWNWVRP